MLPVAGGRGDHAVGPLFIVLLLVLVLGFFDCEHEQEHGCD